MLGLKLIAVLLLADGVLGYISPHREFSLPSSGDSEIKSKGQGERCPTTSLKQSSQLLTLQTIPSYYLRTALDRAHQF